MKLLIPIAAFFTFCVCSVQAQPPQQANRNSQQGSAEQKDAIMLRDQIDNTDTLAIPFDDSEVEDEEELNRLEKREVFPLPHSRK